MFTRLYDLRFKVDDEVFSQTIWPTRFPSNVPILNAQNPTFQPTKLQKKHIHLFFYFEICNVSASSHIYDVCNTHDKQDKG
jgi:hypothetical protein